MVKEIAHHAAKCHSDTHCIVIVHLSNYCLIVLTQVFCMMAFVLITLLRNFLWIM